MKILSIGVVAAGLKKFERIWRVPGEICNYEEDNTPPPVVNGQFFGNSFFGARYFGDGYFK